MGSTNPINNKKNFLNVSNTKIDKINKLTINGENVNFAGFDKKMNDENLKNIINML